MKNIINLIDKINALGEKQIFSPRQRKTVMAIAYLLGMCFISITSVSLLSVNASQNTATIFEIDNTEETLLVEAFEEPENKVVIKEIIPKKVIPKKVITEKKVSNKIISKKVVPNKIISGEVSITQQTLIISGEAIIGDFLAINELGVKSSLDFMSIGQGTLIKGKANPESVVLITTRTGTECSAQTNATGKFGCMFAKEKVGGDDIQVTYQ
ncbi:hypothetical protein LR004_00110 [Candidatus Gracilibacteria bacterium]|nr:hypothetical protein [Candidatus Gracilibacteria bacterium]